MPAISLRYPIYDDKGVLLLGAGKPLEDRMARLLARRDIRLEMHATLLIASRSGTAEVAIGSAPVTVGRGSGSDVRLASGTVSKRHCVFTKSARRVSVRDLGSSNGTLHNGKLAPQEDVELSDGDVIVVGDVKITARIFAALHGEYGRKASGLVVLGPDGEDVGPSEPTTFTKGPRTNDRVR